MITDFKAGDVLSASALNQIVKALNQQQLLPGSFKSGSLHVQRQLKSPNDDTVAQAVGGPKAICRCTLAAGIPARTGAIGSETAGSGTLEIILATGYGGAVINDCKNYAGAIVKFSQICVVEYIAGENVITNTIC